MGFTSDLSSIYNSYLSKPAKPYQQLAITDRNDSKLMRVLNTKYKNLFHDDLFHALGPPQQFFGEKVGINYFQDPAILLDEDGTPMRAAECDDGFEGVAVTDAAFVAVNDVNTQTGQILLWMKRSRQQPPLNNSC